MTEKFIREIGKSLSHLCSKNLFTIFHFFPSRSKPIHASRKVNLLYFVFLCLREAITRVMGIRKEQNQLQKKGSQKKKRLSYKHPFYSYICKYLKTHTFVKVHHSTPHLFQYKLCTCIMYLLSTQADYFSPPTIHCHSFRTVEM